MKKTEVECCDTFCIHEELVHKAEGIYRIEGSFEGSCLIFSRYCRYHTDPDFMCSFQSEMCVCDLAEVLGMTQSAISHQLRMLKQMKLVKNRREGKTVFYSLLMIISRPS